MHRMTAVIWIVLVAMLTLPVPAGAETVYVSDDVEIAVRSGPAADRKIIAMVKSGKDLELVEKGEEWSMVRTATGKEGWIPNRYITTALPSAMALERVRQDYEALSGKYKELRAKSEQLDTQRKTTETDLSQSRKRQDELAQSYETLKRDSSDFLRLKQRNGEMAVELEAEKARSGKLEQENSELRRDGAIYWVLAGGGIMLGGFLMGIYSSSRRKQRSSLY